MKNPLRQLIRSVSKDFQVGSADFLMSKRSMALRRELQQRAMQEAADLEIFALRFIFHKVQLVSSGGSSSLS